MKSHVLYDFARHGGMESDVTITEDGLYFEQKEWIPARLDYNKDFDIEKGIEIKLRLDEIAYYNANDYANNLCINFHAVPGMDNAKAYYDRMEARRQNQIWATLKNTYSENRFYNLLLGNFYGRLCLSGDFDILMPRQEEICRECISFYKELAPLLKDGRLVSLESTVARYRNPKGIQLGIIKHSNQKLLLLHTFGDSKGGEIDYSGSIAKSMGSVPFHTEQRCGKRFIVYEKQDFGALAILLDEGDQG